MGQKDVLLSVCSSPWHLWCRLQKVTPSAKDPICRVLVLCLALMMQPCAGRTNHLDSGQWFGASATAFEDTLSIDPETIEFLSAPRCPESCVHGQLKTGHLLLMLKEASHDLERGAHTGATTGQ